MNKKHRIELGYYIKTKDNKFGKCVAITPKFYLIEDKDYNITRVYLSDIKNIIP